MRSATADVDSTTRTRASRRTGSLACRRSSTGTKSSAKGADLAGVIEPDARRRFNIVLRLDANVATALRRGPPRTGRIRKVAGCGQPRRKSGDKIAPHRPRGLDQAIAVQERPRVKFVGPGHDGARIAIADEREPQPARARGETEEAALGRGVRPVRFAISQRAAADPPPVPGLAECAGRGSSSGCGQPRPGPLRPKTIEGAPRGRAL
jgi:hypothetical protein